MKQMRQKISQKVAVGLKVAQADAVDVAKDAKESTTKRVDIQQLHRAVGLDYPSFRQLLPYRYYDSEYQLFINESSVGFALELAPLAGADESTIHALADMIRFKLPDTVEVQFVLWGHQKVGHQLDRALAEQADCGGMYHTLAKTARQYYKASAISGFNNKRRLPLPLRDYRCFCFISVGDYRETLLQSLTDLRDDVCGELQAAEIQHSRLDVDDFLSLVRDWTSADSQDLYPATITHDPYNELHHQAMAPSFQCQVSPDYVTVQGQTKDGEAVHTRVINLSLTTLPDEFALWMSADNFNNVFRASQGIACPFILSWHFKLMPQAQAKGLANRKYLDRDKKAHSPFARLIPGTVKAAAEWKKIRDDLATDDIRLVKSFTNVVLFSREDHYKQDQSAAITCFRLNGMELGNIHYQQLPSYLATLPFMVSEGLWSDLGVMGRLKKLTSWNMANLLPVVADYKCSQHGLIVPTFRGQWACLYPLDQQLPVDNYNVAVAASSGAGKSFLIQALMMQTLARKGKVWVIDMGESYKKFCHTVGGTYLTVENLQLNPFSHITDINESCEKIRDLLAVLASPQDGLSDVQKSHLLDAVIDAWQRQGNAATIDDVIAYLSGVMASKADVRIDDIVTLLQKYSTQGKNARFFNNYSALAPDTAFAVLELGGLADQPDLMKAVLFALILTIEEQMYQSPRHWPKMCVIDEAWQLLSGSNKEAAQFIEKGFRTARKHYGSFITITQSVKDYHASDEANAAWNNSDIKIIMKQNAKAFQDFIDEKPHYYSSYEQTLIKSFQPSKDNGFSSFMLYIGAVTSFNRLFVDPFSTGDVFY